MKLSTKAWLLAGFLTLPLPALAGYVFRAPSPGIKPTTVVCTHGKSVFDFTGADQSFTVPAGCSQLTFKVWGAAGSGTAGGAIGGGGGYATGVLSTNPGTTYKIVVGDGGGYSVNPYDGGGGAGYTGVFNGTTPVIVAGGGGGAGYTINGGGGGGSSGNTGNTPTGCVYTSGAGGTQTAGGIMGSSEYESATMYGGYLTGGDNQPRGYASVGSPHINGNSGNPARGGGGAGYYGGGMGAAGQCGNSGSSGGGGSSYIQGLISASTVAGDNSGNPGNASDMDRGTAGQSKANVKGNPGRVVISW